MPTGFDRFNIAGHLSTLACFTLALTLTRTPLLGNTCHLVCGQHVRRGVAARGLLTLQLRQLRQQSEMVACEDAAYQGLIAHNCHGCALCEPTRHKRVVEASPQPVTAMR